MRKVTRKNKQKNTIEDGAVIKFINDPLIACGILVFALIALLLSVINFTEALYR